MNSNSLFNNIISLFYPKVCAVCKERLMGKEEFLCLHCFSDLPKTNYHLIASNPAAERFYGKIPIQKACAYLYYNKGGMAQKIVEEIKYHGNRKLGICCGGMIAKDLIDSTFFSEIDLLVPVPLHPGKKKKRGFNQTEIIAKGISEITKIPVDTRNIRRTRANESQTTKNIFERYRNTVNLFELTDSHAMENKHILLIDDVLTSGSTLEAVARAVLHVKGLKVSILTLALA
ncbi:MAG: ComF family protein [Dysgonamonadaceae bacterium]|jgi:ComF family protein|nr:ComF family protein [Dysgonamonadaceae bacterium]